jgi:hypothetical protein
MSWAEWEQFVEQNAPEFLSVIVEALNDEKVVDLLIRLI